MPLFREKWVEIHGVEYRIGCVVRLAEMSLNSCQYYSLFGEVAEILVWEDEKIFVVNVLDTIEFDAQYMAYQVQQSAKKYVKTYHGMGFYTKLQDMVNILLLTEILLLWKFCNECFEEPAMVKGLHSALPM